MDLMREELVGKATSVMEAYEEFIRKYGSGYPRGVLRLIKENIWNSDFRYVPYIREIHSAIGCYPNNEDPYKGFLDIIRVTMGLNRNITAIGNRSFPILPFYIDEEQRDIKEGSVTYCDMESVASILGTIRIRKEKLCAPFILNRTNLLVSSGAKEEIYDVIDMANGNDIDAIISPSYGIAYKDDFVDDCSAKEVTKHQNQVFEYFQDTLPKGRVLSKIYMASNYSFNNPIFISKK